MKGYGNVDRLRSVVLTLDHIMNTKKKRHIIGGILLSASIFFGGLAFTVMSTRDEKEEDEDFYEME